MLWIGLAVFVVVGLGWVIFGQTSRLNSDPVQSELADLILEMMSDDATDDAQMIFQVSVARVLMTRMIDPRERQTRLAHALSMVKPRLNEVGYDVARGIIRRMP